MARTTKQEIIERLHNEAVMLEILIARAATEQTRNEYIARRHGFNSGVCIALGPVLSLERILADTERRLAQPTT